VPARQKFFGGAGVAVSVAVTQKVMIPLRYLSGLFDGNENSKLVLPHIMRGLKSDLTLQAFNRAFFKLDGVDPGTVSAFSNYSVKNVYYLYDSYRVDDAVLAMLNERYASKQGLVQEYYTYYGDQLSMKQSANIEVRRAVSQAVDVLLSASLTSARASLALDSLANIAITDDQSSQWRHGSMYTTNTQVEGVVEHYAQLMYYARSLRGCKETAVTYADFATGGRGAYPGLLAKNNVVSGSGIAINNSMTLSCDLDTGLADAAFDKDVYVFLRHARRIIAFLENVKLEL
jgi:hypothetical protein